ncbi:MAG: transposase [Clostridia bacterium]|nr:transposase [Clostridia bacterium]
MPVVFHRELPWGSHVFKVELKEDCLGAEYYLLYSFYCDTPEAEAVIPPPENILGLDYAQDGLYVDSEGRSGDYPGFKAIGRARAVRYREAANRCVYGSRNWVKYQRRLKKYEQHMRNQREDWQYNRAKALADEYDAIACETLDFKEMQTKNPVLIPKMRDNCWGLFRKKLDEKLSGQGKTLVSIDRYSPTSQLCSRCGYRAGKLPLSERIFRCPNCGLEMDRDLNAAINIREEGANMLLAG